MKPRMAEALRPFLAVIGARYRMLLQYRAAAFAGFGTQLFWGAIKLMILAAFYRVASSEPPMSMTQIIAYVWLGQALFALLGTIYGGDGRTTFGLPDLRGRIPVHQGSGPGLSTRRLGGKGGRWWGCPSGRCRRLRAN